MNQIQEFCLLYHSKLEICKIMPLQSPQKDTSEMPFSASDTALVIFLILIHFALICLVFEIARLSRYTHIDYELAEVDELPTRFEFDRWIVVPASSESLPEYAAVDTSPPPPYKEDVDLGIFVVEVEEYDDE
jgi:hypothetical protein